ncbi:MAG TPA: L,D-transpeptidase family protein [Roseiarcus sp.]|nr:L,D-transpeptidase family protein [Roseiarcus sp.]
MAIRVTFTGGLLCLALNCAGAAAQEAPAPSPAPVAASSAPATPVPTPAATPAPTAAAPPPAAASAAPIPVDANAGAPPKPKKKIAPPAPPLETALSSDPAPTLQPDTFFATEKAAERYAAIVEAGGWPTDVAPLRPGAKGPAVAKLRKRLAIEGDLDAAQAAEGPASESWDADLSAAVKRFQARMGLRQNGLVAGATLKAINVPAGVRSTQLAASARRLAAINFSFGDRYVVVNLPSTSVEAVEDGRVVHRYVAIVGDVEHPSPEIAAHISVINLNPTWTVPTSIIKNEIIPKMLKDPGYLARQKIRILDASGTEVDPKTINWASERAASYTLRQDSGAGNSLGAIRIGMPNKLAVYMHDTPSKRLFGSDYRFLSHGCVRVQGVYDYAEWLLQGTSGGPSGAWDKAALQAKVKEGAREDVKLARPVPVIWVYLTGWSNQDGVANFRDDVYGVDASGEATASASSAAPPAAPGPALLPGSFALPSVGPSQ